MEIYIITLVVLVVFAIIEIRIDLTEFQHKNMAVFVYCLFVFQVGFRWQTGTDWVPYLEHFGEMVRFSDINLTLTGFEKGYSLFVLFVKFFSNNYTVFLVVHALLFYYFIFSVFKKFSPYLFVSLLVFYATTLGFMGSNRQLIALGICLYSLKFVMDKNPYKFFALIGIAYLFHITSILFCVFYFFYRDIKQSKLILILIVSFILGKSSVPTFIFSFVGEYIGGMAVRKSGVYLEEAIKNKLTIIGLIRRLVYFSIFMMNYKFLTARLPYYKLIFNGYFFGLVVYFLFSETLSIMVNRGSLYFNAMEPLLLSCQFLVFQNRVERGYLLILLFVASVFLLFQSISGYDDLFIPYKGIYINTQFHRFRLD